MRDMKQSRPRSFIRDDLNSSLKKPHFSSAACQDLRPSGESKPVLWGPGLVGCPGLGELLTTAAVPDLDLSTYFDWSPGYDP